MPELVQEGGYPLGAGRETGTDADEAIGLVKARKSRQRWS
jgi:hypothetical protein